MNSINYVINRQGIDCVAEEFYGGFKLADLSDYGEFLASCPDLYSVLLNGMKYETLIQTSGKMFLKINGALSTYSMEHFDKPSAGRNVSERCNLAMIIKAFQFVLGPNWNPVALRITDKDPSWLDSILPSRNYDVYTEASDIAVIFKTSELIRKNKYFDRASKSLEFDIYNAKVAVQRVLQSMVNSYAPTLEEFSGFFDYSGRTTIRSLAKLQTSYKEIIERHLFLNAVQLLENQSLQIEDISLLLGYAHPSNFIRAFKRWSATTPQRYRVQLSTL